MVEALCNYGPLQRGKDYHVISEGVDYYLVRVQGKALYAFKWVFED